MNISKYNALHQAKNIGPTIYQKLNTIGIYTLADLAEVTPPIAYQKMKSLHPDKTLPKCYYLYSLQGALMDIHWDQLPQNVKMELKNSLTDLSLCSTLVD